jgi:hypothetical protein
MGVRIRLALVRTVRLQRGPAVACGSAIPVAAVSDEARALPDSFGGRPENARAVAGRAAASRRWDAVA